MKKYSRFISSILLVFYFTTSNSHDKADALLQGFIKPSDKAKPRVWWHWMNGNITKDGIRKDLDWMKRVGIGGFQNFDTNLFTPLVVPEKRKSCR